MAEIELTEHHRIWIERKLRNPRYQNRTAAELQRLIQASRGKCDITDVEVRFHGMTRGDYADIDHIDQDGEGELRIRASNINDLKHNEPEARFQELIATPAWRTFVDQWTEIALDKSGDEAIRIYRLNTLTENFFQNTDYRRWRGWI